MKKLCCFIVTMLMVLSTVLPAFAACSCDTTAGFTPIANGGRKVEFVEELGMFVAAGQPGLLTSVDGVNWTCRNYSGASWHYADFAYGADQLIMLEKKTYSQRLFVLDKYLNSSKVVWARCGEYALSVRPMIVYDKFTGYFYAGAIEYDISDGSSAVVKRLGMYRTKGNIGLEKGTYIDATSSLSIAGSADASINVMQWERVDFGANDVYYEINDWFTTNTKSNWNIEFVYKYIAIDAQGRLAATAGTGEIKPYNDLGMKVTSGGTTTPAYAAYSDGIRTSYYTLLAQLKSDGTIEKSARRGGMMLFSLEFDPYGYCYYSGRRTNGVNPVYNCDGCFHFDSALNDTLNVGNTASWILYSSDNEVTERAGEIYPAGFGTAETITTGEGDEAVQKTWYRHYKMREGDRLADHAIYSKEYDKMIFVPFMSRETGYLPAEQTATMGETPSGDKVYDNDIRIMSYKTGNKVSGNTTFNYVNSPSALYTLFRNGYVDSNGTRQYDSPAYNANTDYTKSNHVASVATGNGKLVIMLGAGLWNSPTYRTEPGKIFAIDISDIKNMDTNVSTNDSTDRANKVLEATVSFPDNAIKFTKTNLLVAPGEKINLRDLVLVRGGGTDWDYICEGAPVDFAATASSVNDRAYDAFDLDAIDDSADTLSAFDTAELGETYTVELKATCENSPSVYCVSQLQITVVPGKQIVLNGTATDIGLGESISGLQEGSNTVKIQFNDTFKTAYDEVVVFIALYHGDKLESIYSSEPQNVAAGDTLNSAQCDFVLPTDADDLDTYTAKVFLWSLSPLKPL